MITDLVRPTEEELKLWFYTVFIVSVNEVEKAGIAALRVTHALHKAMIHIVVTHSVHWFTGGDWGLYGQMIRLLVNKSNPAPMRIIYLMPASNWDVTWANVVIAAVRLSGMIPDAEIHKYKNNNYSLKGQCDDHPS